MFELSVFATAAAVAVIRHLSFEDKPTDGLSDSVAVHFRNGMAEEMKIMNQWNAHNSRKKLQLLARVAMYSVLYTYDEATNDIRFWCRVENGKNGR